MSSPVPGHPTAVETLAQHPLYTESLQRLPVQCKLSIGAVDDPLEDEADAMADKVMRMPDQRFIQRKCSHCEEEEAQRKPLSSFIQRKCSHCEEEEAQRKPLTSFIQRKGAGNSHTTSDSTHSQIQSTRGGGITMPANTKTFMESRFGADFSNVRVHSGGYASQLSNDLNAHAFTVGNDIYFNKGKYSPDSSDGKHLLAHELTHTIQQKATPANAFVRRQPAPMPPIPSTAPPGPAPMGSDVLKVIGAQVAIDDYHAKLREAVLAPVSNGRHDGINFLSRVRSVSAVQADLLAADDEFLAQVRTLVGAKNLWTVFTLLHLHNNIHEPHVRLKSAVLNHDARLVADMLSLVVPSYHVDRYFTILREVVSLEFNGDPLLNEILRLIDHRTDAGITQREAGSYQEIHYEKNTAGTFALTTFTGNVSADSYFSGNELRVIVKINFLDGNDTVACPSASAPGCAPFYFPGLDNAKYDGWLTAIKNVWNGRFHLDNSSKKFDIVFVPLFLAEPDVNATKIRIMTNTALKCDPSLQPGRSEESCWFVNVPTNVVAHEFGHIIGASDEYNLPGSNLEITNAGFTMSAQDMALSSMQGITGTALPSNPNKEANTTRTLMGKTYTNNNVEARHLTRLLALLNSGLPAGIAKFRIVPGKSH